MTKSDLPFFSLGLIVDKTCGHATSLRLSLVTFYLAQCDPIQFLLKGKFPVLTDVKLINPF